MAKKNVKKMMGVMAGVFAHTGHLDKEEARELAGMEPEEFEGAYGKAAKIVKKLEKYDNIEDRYGKFADHLYEEIAEYMKLFTPFSKK